MLIFETCVYFNVFIRYLLCLFLGCAYSWGCACLRVNTVVQVHKEVVSIYSGQKRNFTARELLFLPYNDETILFAKTVLIPIQGKMLSHPHGFVYNSSSCQAGC